MPVAQTVSGKVASPVRTLLYGNSEILRLKLRKLKEQQEADSGISSGLQKFGLNTHVGDTCVALPLIVSRVVLQFLSI